MTHVPCQNEPSAHPLDRRALLHSLMLAGAGFLLADTAMARPAPVTAGGPLFKQPLPDLTMHDWQMSAVEVVYRPGQMDEAHRHPGFVFGYVIEGELKFQVDGGTETTYKAGQMFYEAPGGVHRVSGNASATKPARLLAMIIADKSSPVTGPV